MSWVFPTIGYVLIVGTLGVTTKAALETVTWPQLLVWTTAAYALLATVAMVASGSSMTFGKGTALAALSGLLLGGGALMLFLALERGEASLVVPVSSIYPLVTLVLSAILLAEQVTIARVFGVVVVITGLVIITR